VLSLTVCQIRKETFRNLLSLIAAFCVVVCLATTARASSPEKKKLTAANVMELLDGGVSLVRIASLVQERGIDFQLTSQLEQDFRNGGADQNVINALKGQSANTAAPSAPAPSTQLPAPQETPPAAPVVETPPKSVPSAPPGARTGRLQITSHPGGADIYVDDTLKGTTDADEGRLEVVGLKPGKHHLRATRDGFQNVEGDVDVAAGQALDMPLWLAKAEAPPPPAPTTEELPPGRKFLVQHTHRPIAGISSGGYCRGWMIVNVGYVRYISTDSYHKYLFNSSEMKEAKPDGEAGGFHIKLATGRNYQFVAVNDKGEPVSAGPVLSEIRYSKNE
jgi:hypothetical protein